MPSTFGPDPWEAEPGRSGQPELLDLLETQGRHHLKWEEENVAL